MGILTQFLFRLSFGLALAMAWTPSRLVTSGFYRVHCLVLLGMNVVSTLIALSNPEFGLWPPLLAAVLSYCCSVVWLYERSTAGVCVLYLVAVVTLTGATLTWPPASLSWSLARTVFVMGDVITSGLVLGVTITAMFLGHWYLNTPTMDLVPLKRLVLLMIAALIIRSVFCAGSLLDRLMEVTPAAADNPPLYFYALRWLFGLVAAMLLAVMTWATLKVPNTQSATGILYVAVIATFLGELTSLLLSLDATYPV